MRLSLRFVLPLLVALGLLAYAVTPLIERLTVRWFERDLDLRASLITNAIDEPLRELIQANDTVRVRSFFTRIGQDERIYAIAYCATPASEPLATESLPGGLQCAQLEALADSANQHLPGANGMLLILSRPLATEAAPAGKLILVHDISFMSRRSAETRQYLFYFFIALGLVVSFITVVIAQLSWRGWMQGLRTLVRGGGLLRPSQAFDSPELRPIANDLRVLIQEIQGEHRSRDEEQMAWAPETLREILHRELKDQDVIVVSNREPYIHVRQGDDIVIQRPASGLVTALEPVMRACSGTWIAHGSGSADRDVVDTRDRLDVPVDNPAYQLRRIWLTREEEAGYYYGFANEGLWPLCHIAHVRPTFRTSDFAQYRKVNQRFAEAVMKESKSSDPLVLVQDYHFALLPRMIRDALPDATVITFWHIPWPNPEAFAICPWREELLDGLLGSSILGFHTQFHCNNFVDTVDRLLEARADRETFTVSYKRKLTAVKRFPISVDWPPPPELLAKPVDECRTEVRLRHGLPPDHAIGIGVDRLDYTKGIEEKFRAVERLMEMHPEWVGRFSFIQIAAPTRASIEQYQEYEMRVRAEVTRINGRFVKGSHPPIILAARHHEPVEVYEYFRAAELCFVSSLHDGMNLVAKEFISARNDEQGVLVLSQFTGAARELPEALVVNPYDTDQCAAALDFALTMSSRAQRQRIGLMRGLVKEFNVYRWAGRMLIDAATMRRRGQLVDRAALGHRPSQFAGRRVE